MLDARIGIIGKGNVGSALHKGLNRAGYDVEATGNDPQRVRKIAENTDLIILAVPFAQRQNAIDELGVDNLDGKILIDPTNALDEDGGLAIDPRSGSGAEELQRMAGGARVVKAFNTVFAQTMDKGQVNGEPLTVIAAGDDEKARRDVVQLANDIGFDAVEGGPLQNARWLETFGMLNITLGYKVGLGPNMGFRIVRPGEPKRERPHDEQVRQGRA